MRHAPHAAVSFTRIKFILKEALCQRDFFRRLGLKTKMFKVYLHFNLNLLLTNGSYGGKLLLSLRESEC